jgi:hypothetical protein
MKSVILGAIGGIATYATWTYFLDGYTGDVKVEVILALVAAVGTFIASEAATGDLLDEDMGVIDD